jgi:beta-glucosidase
VVGCGDKIMKPSLSYTKDNLLERKVDSVLKMTLEEKVGQLNQYNGFGK